MTTWSCIPERPEMPRQVLQGGLCAETQMSVGCRVVPRYSLPEQAIGPARLGYPQAIDLDICERVRLLLKTSRQFLQAPQSSKDIRSAPPCVSALSPLHAPWLFYPFPVRLR